MSRNAVPLRPGQRPIPLWKDLSANMAKEIWGTETFRRGEDALLVAEYFERVHGRTALDDFLQRQIRDNEFAPSRLHMLLMALPWADVLTTNYDTLLERASWKVIERRYRVLVNQADLAGSSRQPRIIKLHGSFPSNRPFIITKEDFRTYPRRFPAFVNTVQQAVMETALCMIGFSGDDPNFEAWTGWVRDNLGDAAPPVYLCGILDLDISRRSYYQDHKIKPINLAPLFPTDVWPNPDSRHTAALEWLILSLAEGAPVDSMLWPSSQRRLPALPMEETLRFGDHMPARKCCPTATPADHPPSAWSPSSGLPELLAGDSLATPASGEGTDVAQILTRAAYLRQTYPSWLILPHTTFFAHEIRTWFQALKATNPCELELVHAVAWGLDVLQWPFPAELAAQAEKVLESAMVGLPRAESVELLRWLIREAREQDDYVTFQRRMDLYAKLSHDSTIFAVDWWLEKAKCHLMRLELDEAEIALSQIAPQTGTSFADVVRASLMFELGLIREAGEVAAKAIDGSRRSTLPEAESLRVWGEEASALDVLTNALLSLRLEFASISAGNQRRDELRRTGADPRVELDLLGADLAKIVPPMRSTTKDFDPNHYTQHTRYSFDNRHFLPFRYLRALEVSAQLPTNHADDVYLAAKGIAGELPGLSFSILIRAGKNLDEAFPRHVVLGLSKSSARTLWERCETFLRWRLESTRENTPLLERACEGAIDLLSRLTLQSDVVMRRQCLEIALGLHEAEFVRSHFPLHGHLAKLFDRLFLSMSVDELAETLPALVAMTIPGWGGAASAWEQSWEDPCLAFQEFPLKGCLVSRRQELAPKVAELIGVVVSSDGPPRSIAIQRLEALRRADGLGDGALKSYAVALWSRCENSSDVPDVERFLLTLGLHLPIAGERSAKERFTAWALETEFPPLFELAAGHTGRQSRHHWVNRHVNSLSHGTASPWTSDTTRQLLIEWTSAEAEQLLGHVQAWLHDVAAWPSPVLGNFPNRNSDVVELVADLAASLIPLMEVTDAVIARLTAIDVALSALEVLPLRRHPSWLMVDPSTFVANDMRLGLLSLDERILQLTMPLVFEWVAYGTLGRIPQVPDDILDHLFLLTTGGPGRSKILALSNLYNILFHYPVVLSDSRIQRLQLMCEFVFHSNCPNSESDNSESALEWQGDYRTKAASIVSLLALRDTPYSTGFKKYLKLAEDDVYPEVRQACRDVRAELS